MSYFFHLLIYLDIYVLLSLGLGLIVGYGGLLSLAHAASFALGAYVYAILSHDGVGFVPGIVAAMILAGGAGWAFGMATWGLTDDFFVVVSLAFVMTVHAMLYSWVTPNAPLGSPANLTNGPLGIAGISKPEILGIRFDSVGSMSLLASVVAIAAAMVIWALARGPWGRMLLCVRDDQTAARSIGKSARSSKMQVLAVGSGLAALAGVLYASYIGYIDPTMASLDQSILMLCMVLIGGTGNVRGPVLGALALLAIPEVLRFVHVPSSMASDIRLMAYGVFLVLAMHMRPQGLAGRYRVS